MATFGNILIVSTTFANSAADTASFTGGSIPVDASIISVTVRTRAETGTVNGKGLIYTDSGGVPNTLVGVSPPVSIGTTLQQYTFTFTVPLSVTAGFYWAGMVVDGNLRNYYDDPPVSNDVYYDSPAGFSYTSPPSTFPGGGGGGNGGYERFGTYNATSIIRYIPYKMNWAP